MKLLFRPACLLLLAASACTLSSCGMAHQAWGEAYRHKGGFYDEPKGKTNHVEAQK